MNETQKELAKLAEERHKERVKLYADIFSERLKNLRQEKNYSQKTVAKKLGVAVSTYANWEQGRREPSIYDIFNLLSVYEIEANELFDISGVIR